jgi:hypothetical protein
MKILMEVCPGSAAANSAMIASALAPRMAFATQNGAAFHGLVGCPIGRCTKSSTARLCLIHATCTDKETEVAIAVFVREDLDVYARSRVRSRPLRRRANLT